MSICRRLLCRTFVPCYFAVQSIEESAWTTARRADPVSLGEMSRAVEMPGLGKGSEMTRVAARRRPLARHLAVAFCRSEEHTSELQSLMRISYAVFCLTKKKET